MITDEELIRRPLALGVPVIRREVDRIRKHLESCGWWYPPDAIVAEIEGRDSYWSLGGRERGIRWPLTDAKRLRIRRSILAVVPHAYETLAGSLFAPHGIPSLRRRPAQPQ